MKEMIDKIYYIKKKVFTKRHHKREKTSYRVEKGIYNIL